METTIRSQFRIAKLGAEEGEFAEAFRQNDLGYSLFSPVFVYFEKVSKEIEKCLAELQGDDNKDFEQDMRDYLIRISASSLYLDRVIKETGRLEEYDIDLVADHLSGRSNSI